MKRVYIASPYTNGDVAENVAVQIAAAHKLLDLKYCPVVPTLSHFMHLSRQRPYEDWMEMDFALLEMCDVLLRLPGESAGADREVARARELGIPVALGWLNLWPILDFKTAETRIASAVIAKLETDQ